MIDLYALDVHELNNNIKYQRYYETLSQYRRNRVDAHLHQNDKILSVGAGILLDIGLQRFGLRERTMQYSTMPGGKPLFVEYPSIQFSISHSGNMVVVAFSDSMVGCDIEKMRQVDSNLPQRFFTERDNIVLNFAVDKQKEFFRIWTQKESYVKALGMGLSVPFNSFSLNLEDNQNRYLCPRTGKTFTFIESDRIRGYCCTVCNEGTEQTINRHDVEI